MTMLQKILW